MKQELKCAFRHLMLVIIKFQIRWRAVGTQQNDKYCVPTAR